MTFVNPIATNSAPQANSAQGAKDKEPRTTIGYVNHYIRTKDGSRIKMNPDITLRLYAERKVDVKLIEDVKSGKLSAKQVNGIFEMEISLARDENAEIEFDY